MEITATEPAIPETPVAVPIAEAPIMRPETPAVVTTPESWMRVIEVIPGAGADEDAVHEPLRTPVAVRRARVRRIRIEPVLTYRRRVVGIRTVSRSNLDPKRNLGMGIHDWHRQERQQD